MTAIRSFTRRRNGSCVRFQSANNSTPRETHEAMRWCQVVVIIVAVLPGLASGQDNARANPEGGLPARTASMANARGGKARRICAFTVDGDEGHAIAFTNAASAIVVGGWTGSGGKADGPGDWKTGDVHGVLQLFDCESGKCLWSRTDSSGAILDVATSPDGTLIASAGLAIGEAKQGEIRLWRTAGDEDSEAVLKAAGWFLVVSFSPDGRLLAIGGSDGRTSIYDVTKRKLVTTLPQHESGIIAAAFAADSRYIAVATREKIVRYRTSTWQEIESLRADGMILVDVAVSHDGARIAACGAKKVDGQGVIVLYDARGEKAAKVLRHGKKLSSSVAFSSDARYLAAVGLAESPKIWRVGDESEHSTIPQLNRSSNDKVAFAFDVCVLGTTKRRGGACDISIWKLP